MQKRTHAADIEREDVWNRNMGQV